MPKIKIDEEKCIGCNLCESICPESFKLGEEKAIVKKSKVDKIGSEKEAADSCPVEAIEIC